MASEKILVVDDEPDIVDTIEFRLKSKGYKVISAYDGLEALEKARSEKPDLIVLDVMLPKMDGFQVCRLLKFDENFKDIPIVMLTAKTQESDKAAGTETGADEYMTKPFESEKLIEVVDRLLS